MDALVVVNRDNFLCQNARRSFISACCRWRVDYVEIGASSLDGLHPAYCKAESILRLAHYERVAVFDADMLIREDAPNCFHWHPQTTAFYAVKDRSQAPEHVPVERRFDITESVRVRFYQPIHERLHGTVSLHTFVREFFNSGFFLCNPALHGKAFRLMIDNLPHPDEAYAQNPHYEQALLNYCVQWTLGSSMEFADETWNYIDPDIRIPIMSRFVYHFTGTMYQTLKPAIRLFPWTV